VIATLVMLVSGVVTRHGPYRARSVESSTSTHAVSGRMPKIAPGSL